MKNLIKILIIVLFIITISPLSLAHRGRTDSNGGHYSSSGYHYHHGYSAHQHPNGICPYEIEYDDLIPFKCSKCKATVIKENGNYCFECGYKLINNPVSIGGVHIGKSSYGDENKTRLEYYNEVQKLENTISEKENIINNLMTSSNEKDNNIKKLEEQNTKLRNIGSIMLISTFILCIVFYSIGNCERKKGV